METNEYPNVYQIHIKGHLDEHRMRWFEGFTVLQHQNGETIISGEMDQAALHGVLNRIRDLGMVIISVKCLVIKGKSNTNGDSLGEPYE
ncbi:MAG: hypothetical protein FP831_16680 [Anaerolineae bacterium]|nr:hypothetical protein [Anaerolineae bacterium]